MNVSTTYHRKKIQYISFIVWWATGKETQVRDLGLILDSQMDVRLYYNDYLNRALKLHTGNWYVEILLFLVQ